MNWKRLHPRWLFLVDGIGALISALFLGVILVQLVEFIGMPVRVLYLLAGLATVFALYSLSCFLFFPEKWKPFLIIITSVNVLYSLLTIGLIVYYFSILKPLGIAYFITEIIILFIIVRLETSTILQAQKIK